MLVLENIHKQFDGKNVLDGISLTVNKGEIVSLLGPSGSGKTTLLNIILGLVPHDQGRILFDDIDLSSTSMKERGFNIVFQDYALFPNLNAYDNITYSMKNWSGRVTKQELDSYIEFLELGPHLDKRIHELSGGQKQRVALARTLVTKPRLLLLDEPFSALDGVIRESIKDRVKSIAKNFGLTTLIVTHDPEEAMTLSDKVLIINGGKVAQFAAPREVIESPKDGFVEEFIMRQLVIKRNNLQALFGAQYV